MSKEKKPGKRAYLDSFQPNVAGEYFYTGAHYLYSEENEKTHKRILTELWCATGAAAVYSIGSGLLPAPGPIGCVYVIIPLVAEIILTVAVIWTMTRLSIAGCRMRSYVYTATVEKLPIRAIACAIAACAGLIAEAVFLILNGFDRHMYASIIYMLIKPSISIIMCIISKKIKSTQWDRIEP